MANEIKDNNRTPGITLYTVVRRGTQAWKPGTSEFGTYTTTRSDFAYSSQAVDANGDYGPYNLPGDGLGRYWQICQRVGGSPAHSDPVLREGSSDFIRYATNDDIGELADAVDDANSTLEIVEGKLNPHFEAFFSENTGDRNVDDLTTPKNITISGGSS